MYPYTTNERNKRNETYEWYVDVVFVVVVALLVDVVRLYEKNSRTEAITWRETYNLKQHEITRALKSTVSSWSNAHTKCGVHYK